MRREEERAVQMVVEEVADEVFCRLPRMLASRGVPLLRMCAPNMQMFFGRVSSNGTRLASKTNTQMTSEAEATTATRPYYKEFAEASPPLPNADRQGG
jgi:hypothetical protein